ncbi:hypothetical protein B0T13DRAFT_95077 [Neurospora crassa]|nr:hypothetical protein B0T13DRAFT_95077 [Neurospora crassa]
MYIWAPNCNPRLVYCTSLALAGDLSAAFRVIPPSQISCSPLPPTKHSISLPPPSPSPLNPSTTAPNFIRAYSSRHLTLFLVPCLPLPTRYTRSHHSSALRAFFGNHSQPWFISEHLTHVGSRVIALLIWPNQSAHVTTAAPKPWTSSQPLGSTFN